MNSLLIAFVLIGFANCDERLKAMPMKAADEEGGDGSIQVIVNYFNDQMNNHTSLTKRVEALERQVDDLKYSMDNGWNDAENVEGLGDCGCPPGRPGPVGPSGPQGAPGPVGPAGSSGRTGATGYPGSYGRGGATGATGQPGNRGRTGASGYQGAYGQKGTPGATGSRGVTGAKGRSG